MVEQQPPGGRCLPFSANLRLDSPEESCFNGTKSRSLTAADQIPDGVCSMLTGSGPSFPSNPLKPSKFREFGKLMPRLTVLIRLQRQLWLHQSRLWWRRERDEDQRP